MEAASINNLTSGFEAFSKAQGQFRAAAKDASNPFFKSKYADLASIWSAIGTALCDNGLFVTQPIRIGEAGGFFIETLIRYKDGTLIESCMCPVIAKSQNDPQALGSAITYARRYSLASILCIVTDDDDAEAATGRTQQQPAQQSQQRQPYQKPAQQAAPVQPAQQPAQPEPKKLSKQETAQLMKDLDIWNKQVGELDSDAERSENPEAWQIAATSLGAIPNLPRTEQLANFKGLCQMAANHGIEYDKSSKSFFNVALESNPSNEELSQALANNG